MVLIVLWKRRSPPRTGSAYATAFTWERCASQTLALYRYLYEPHTGTTKNRSTRSELDRRSDTGVSVLPLSARRISPAQITVVCQPWVASVQFRHLVDEVYVLPQPRRASTWGQVQALEAGVRALRAHGPWDLGICLPNSFSSAWLLARAGVRWRRGYATDGRGFLLHDKLAWEPHSNSTGPKHTCICCQLLCVPTVRRQASGKSRHTTGPSLILSASEAI